MVFTDTDISVLKMVAGDVYEDQNYFSEWWEFNDYHASRPNYDKTNKKVLGNIEDELNGRSIPSFMGQEPL